MNIHSLHQTENDSSYIWVNDFDENSMKVFYQQFMQLESDPSIDVITIIIDSPGGEVTTLLGMRDLIKSSIKPVATVAIGKAQSCGAFLLAAGTAGMRFVAPNAQIMVHESSGGAMGTINDILTSVEWMSTLNKLVLENLATDIGIPLEKLKKQIQAKSNTDWHLSAQETVNLGLADIIAIPRIYTPPMSVASLVTVKAVRSAVAAPLKKAPAKPAKKRKP
jgi:ATP-dependent Clp protease protease subunit